MGRSPDVPPSPPPPSEVDEPALIARERKRKQMLYAATMSQLVRTGSQGAAGSPTLGKPGLLGA